MTSYSDLTFMAIQAALQAGELLKKGFGTSFKVDSKEGRQNLVTEYDVASQELIISTISAAFPSHHFVAEESSSRALEFANEDIVWIIDPLDGTVNFAHHLPFFSISIAAVKNKSILCGVVLIPMLNELFVAEKNKGAYFNGKRIHVSTTHQLEEALLATGLPYNAHENPLRCIDRISDMSHLGAPLRRFGSAAIDMAYVAASRFDLFWEVGLQSWDRAAGKLLVEEAGGRVSQYDGSEHDLYSYQTMLATNGILHSKMVALLKEDLRYAD